MQSLATVLRNYADAFRELINSKVPESYDDLQAALRLNKAEDWGFVCCAMDIIGDALLALESFLRFGLDGPTKYDEDGEKYLRLYGVLNAAYIQQGAVCKLHKLMNCPNSKDVRASVDALAICGIRHKLGAHCVDYCEDWESGETASFVPVRICLGGFTCVFTDTSGVKAGEVDVQDLLQEHLRLMIEILDGIYEKAVQTLHRGHEKVLAECAERLEYLRIEKDGGLVIRSAATNGETKPIFVVAAPRPANE